MQTMSKTKHEAWRVYEDGKQIDTVFYSAGMHKDEVKRSLINHDGYNDHIVIMKG